MSAPDLQTKLLNSESAVSLIAEQKVAVTLQRLDWRVVHSWYFTDQNTGKLRETDVIGRQVWERNLKNGREAADLNLLIESKSAKGFHLIFSPIENINSFGIVNTWWLGQEGENRERVMETLTAPFT